MEKNIKELEREYVIPLRKSILKAPRYERTRIAIREIKRFLLRHMKIRDRDPKKVKIDVYLNNDIWFKGRKNPPTKIKVKVIKREGILLVNFATTPDYVKFLKNKIEKRHKKEEKKEKKKDEKENKAANEKDKLEDKLENEKKDNDKRAQEKKKLKDKENKNENKIKKDLKHITNIKEPKIQRKALKK